MKTLSKQILILLLTLFGTLHSFGQDNKFSLRLEYVPNYSKITDEFVQAKYKLSHQGWIGLDYRLTDKIRPTVAIGFLNTGERVTSSFEGQLGIEEYSFRYNYNYLAIPIGLKWNFGSFYLHPEIGFAIGISQVKKQIVIFSDGRKEVEKSEEQLAGGEFNQVTIPLLVTFGKEFKIGNLTLLTGIKGTYGINRIVSEVPRKNHYYSLGLMVGIKL